MLDLEGLAEHRGSSFGALGMPSQPTNQQFENMLALRWASFSPSEPVYIEDESRSVGKCGVPDGLWARMRAADATVLRLEVPDTTRVDRLVGEYGAYSPSALAGCVRQLSKRLGPERTAEATDLLEAEPFGGVPSLRHVASLMLQHYYDARYDYQARGPGDARAPAQHLHIPCAYRRHRPRHATHSTARRRRSGPAMCASSRATPPTRARPRG